MITSSPKLLLAGLASCLALAPVAFAQTPDPDAEVSTTTTTTRTEAPAPDPNAGVPAGTVIDPGGMVPAPEGGPVDPSAPVGSAANPVVVGGNVTPPPPPRADYPVCSRTVRDACRNPGSK